MSFLIPITKNIKEINLEKGVFIFIHRASKIPPHIGLIVNGKLFEISTHGPEYNLSGSAMLQAAQKRGVELVLVELKPTKQKPEELDLLITNLVKHYFKVSDHVSCLNPIKDFIQKIYQIEVKKADFIFELLPILYNKNLVKDTFQVNLTEQLLNNNFLIKKYTKQDINQSIAAVNRKKNSAVKSATIYLRNLISSDASIVFDWENNPANWEVSNTKTSFTREEIEEFLNQPQDINLQQQLRFVICKNDSNLPIGCIDLFDYKVGKSVGVGILIADKKWRNKGYATEALKLLINYCNNELKIDSIFCHIFKENTISIRLFESCGFKFIEERLLDGNKVNYYEIKNKLLSS